MAVDLMVGIAILITVLLPMSTAFFEDQKAMRAYYYQALAMSIVDGEMEALAAGEWKSFETGVHTYTVKAQSATNLPPGRFILTREDRRLELEWRPDKRGVGGAVSRQAIIP